MNVRQIEKYITEYGNDVYRFCYYLTRSKELADDLYQDCFLTVMEKETIVLQGKEKNYLIGVAANIWKNKWRKEKRRQEFIIQAEFNDDYMSDKDNLELLYSKDPLDFYVDKETASLVSEIVNSLPEQYRIVVLMYYSAEMSTSDIAKELHMSKGTVTSRLMRARKLIKTGLEAKGYER